MRQQKVLLAEAQPPGTAEGVRSAVSSGQDARGNRTGKGAQLTGLSLPQGDVRAWGQPEPRKLSRRDLSSFLGRGESEY